MTCTGDFLKNFEPLRFIFLGCQISRIVSHFIGFWKVGKFHAVVVLEDFFNGSVIVSKQAPLSIRAIEFLIESCAGFRLVLGVSWGQLSN